MFGFNLWKVAIIIAIVVIALVGTRRYYLARPRQVGEAFGLRTVRWASAWMAAIIAVMLYAESFDDVLARVDAQAIKIGQDLIFSPSIAAIDIIIGACLLWAGLVVVGYVAGLAKAGWLYTDIERQILLDEKAERALQRVREEENERRLERILNEREEFRRRQAGIGDEEPRPSGRSGRRADKKD